MSGDGSGSGRDDTVESTDQYTESTSQQPNRPDAGQPAGQPAGQSTEQPAAGHQQRSITDLLKEPDAKGYMKGIAGVMALVGVGLGVMVFLLGAFGGSSVTTAGRTVSSARYKLGLVNTALSVGPYVAFAIAPVAGLFTGFRLDGDQRKAMGTVAVGVLVGTILLVVIAAALTSTQTPSQVNVSIDYGQLVINSVLMGVGAAIPGVAGAYLARETDL